MYTYIHIYISADSSACQLKKVSRSEGSREAPGNFPRQASPGLPRLRQAPPQRPRRSKIRKFTYIGAPGPPVAPKRTPIEDFALRKSKMRARSSFSHRQTHPYRRFRRTDVQNASVVFIFASPNAPLSHISPLGSPKCERGVFFCIPKRTPVAGFACRTSKMRARCSFSPRQTHPYPGSRVSDV